MFAARPGAPQIPGVTEVVPRALLRALAQSVVPETAGLNPAGWSALERTVATAIGARPPKVQRQVRLFLHIIGWLPLLRYGRPFTRLDPRRRERFLASLQSSRLLLIRRGFWGLRTLILMGYYTQADVIGAIGYRADPRGWSVRR